MEDILGIAERNQQRAWEIIKETGVINIWESIGAEINLVGSLRTGLLMKHRDIDFHIYSAPLDIQNSFGAIARLAIHPSITKIEYRNYIDTEEKCIEWHAWYLDRDNELWQLDMIHILKGSFYDGYFEKMAERILAVMTPEINRTILTLKYKTPDTEKIMGVEYYRAVIEGGVSDYNGFMEWRRKNPNPQKGIIHWIP